MPNPMFPATVMFGNSAYDWKTIPTLRWFGGSVGDVRRRRSMMRPAVGFSKPAIIRSVVVLPQPDGPRNETNSPFSAARLKSIDGGDVAEHLLDAGQFQEGHLTPRLPTGRR